MSESGKHLLLVEDEPALREALAEQLAGAGFAVDRTGTGEEALSLLADYAYDIVVTDVRLPGLGGGALLDEALARYPEIVVILMTGYGSVRDAVQAIKRGAADFVTKPFQIDELLHAIDAAIDHRRLRSENAYLREQLQTRYGFDELVGHSPAMRALYEVLETVAASTSTILITGETGTGKEVVARAVHHNSPRRRERFVAINCGAIPESLLEAELFGHVRGAFTGAIGNRAGRIEQAQRGTLFLDEIGTMSVALQSKLLRVLQEREVERLGGTRSIPVDVRVIAATHANLERLVEQGAFREDLYYRLNVIPIALPPLRDRREDIPLLIQHFLARFAEGGQAQPDTRFSQDALRLMMAYDWPGNVRQLENVVERVLAISPGQTMLDVASLPLEIQGSAASWAPAGLTLPEEGIDLEAYLAGVEHALITQSLGMTRGNKRRAADLLGLKRTTLVEKLKRLERRLERS